MRLLVEGLSGRIEARPWRVFEGSCAALVFIALFAASSTAGASDFSQQAFRINPVAGEAYPSSTLKDCLEDELCQTQLVFAIGRIGGNPGLLAKPQAQPTIFASGNATRYDFAPPEAQHFCRAELVKLSVAPSFGENATEMSFEAGRGAASITVRLPATAPRAWFDGILILIAAASNENCTLTDQKQSYSCKGRCETVRF